MITLIGKQTTIIGFGLCGIKDTHQVTKDTDIEDIITIIKQSKNPIIMIEEKLEKKLGDIDALHLGEEKKIITIPDKHEPDEKNELNALIKDTLGIDVR